MMCALQRVNPQSQQPEKEPQPGNGGDTPAWPAYAPGHEGNGLQANGPQAQPFPTATGGGSIFSIPASLAPQDIPGFPAPPGSSQPGVQASQGNAQGMQ